MAVCRLALFSAPLLLAMCFVSGQLAPRRFISPSSFAASLGRRRVSLSFVLFPAKTNGAGRAPCFFNIASTARRTVRVAGGARAAGEKDSDRQRKKTNSPRLRFSHVVRCCSVGLDRRTISSMRNVKEYDESVATGGALRESSGNRGRSQRRLCVDADSTSTALPVTPYIR